MNRLVMEEETQMVNKHDKMYKLTSHGDKINKMASKVR